MKDIRIFNTKEELYQAAAEIFLRSGAAAQQRRGRFAVVLSGGSTPLPLYQILAETKTDAALDWDEVHFFWGDERSVGPGHPESNYRAAYQALLEPKMIPEQNIHRILGELLPQEAAQIYNQDLQSWFGSNPPSFDLVLLGLGGDGHTASLFPGTEVVGKTGAAHSRWVEAVEVPQLGTWRITMTSRLINNALRVVFLVSGKSKATVLEEVLQGPFQPETYPAQLIGPAQGELIWLVDRDAAVGLGSGTEQNSKGIANG